MSRPKLSEMLKRAFDSSDELYHVLLGPNDDRSAALVKRAKKRMAADGVLKKMVLNGVPVRLGYDLTSVAEMARSEKMRSEGHRQMAEHGHADLGDDSESPWDMEALKSHLLARYGEDDWEEAMDGIRRLMHGGRDGEEDQRERQDRLEHAEKEVAEPHRRDDERAKMTEHRMSEQSEDRRKYARDRIPKNHINGNGRGGHMATDAGFAALVNRVGTSMSCGGITRERSTGPNNIALDLVEQNAKFLERLARLEAGR